jgi:hypothetical protein
MLILGGGVGHGRVLMSCFTSSKLLSSLSACSSIFKSYCNQSNTMLLFHSFIQNVIIQVC